MKLFRTNNIEIVKSCQYYFNFQPPSLLWSERVKKFGNKYDLFTGSVSAQVRTTQAGSEHLP